MEFEVQNNLNSSEIENLQDIASSGPIKAEDVDKASRFVLGYEDGDLVSYSSLKPSYPQGTDVSDYAVEIFQVGVDEQLRGRGLGRETFERSLEEAEKFGEEKDLDHVYMTVWNDTTELYQEIKESVKENEDYFSDDKIAEHCEENGIDTEELYEINPMNHLAEEYGFEPHEKQLLRNTVHIAERPVQAVKEPLP